MTRPPVTAAADKDYVRREFVELSSLCRESGRDLQRVREEFSSGIRPRPTYTLDDGSEFVPSDYFSLETDKDRFEYRLRARAAALGVELHDVDEVWSDYLSGDFGICLIHVTPENIVEKGQCIERIEQFLKDDRRDDAWRDELSQYVDRLDGLERPFCAYDREIAEGPVSRDLFITAVREQYELSA